jgi:hypothetical protein
MKSLGVRFVGAPGGCGLVLLAMVPTEPGPLEAVGDEARGAVTVILVGAEAGGRTVVVVTVVLFLFVTVGTTVGPTTTAADTRCNKSRACGQ